MQVVLGRLAKVCPLQSVCKLEIKKKNENNNTNIYHSQLTYKKHNRNSMNMKVKLLENHVQSQSSEFLIVLAFGIVFDIRYQPSI